MNKNGRPVNILLIEDNPGDVRLTKEAFKESGMNVNLSVVMDGVEALLYLRREGEYKDIDVEPTKYVMLTYWTSKDVHEEFHRRAVIMDGFMSLMPFLSIMPYEEYGAMKR